jgi:hypothetical protein
VSVRNNRYKKRLFFISEKWYRLAQPMPITSYQPIRKTVFVVVCISVQMNFIDRSSRQYVLLRPSIMSYCSDNVTRVT